jgi:O-antigen/teichoic acid export membrane protein
MERAPLPEGTIIVTVGVFLAGLTAYGFLVISGRALGPKLYADLSVLWVMGFIGGPGVFMPLEQEVSRAIAARRARGIGAAPVLRRAIVLGAAMFGVLVVTSAAVFSPVNDRLFDHHSVLFLAFLLSLASLYVGYVARGYLSGNRRFGSYSALVAAEGMLRLLPAVALAYLGLKTVGMYGLAFGIAPLISATLVLSRNRRLVAPGPQAPWGELTAALGYLVAASLLAQLLVNLAPIAVKLLSSPAQEPLAGRFLAGLVIARVPVVLFQAVLAALLPKLAHLAARGDFPEFTRTLRRLLATVTALGVAAILGAVALGQFALRMLFGAQFHLGRADFGYLSAASIVFIVALTFGQALIALRAYASLTVGWIAGSVGFAVVLAAVHGLLLRVELAFLLGSAVSAVLLGALLRLRVATGVAPVETDADQLLESLSPQADETLGLSSPPPLP